MLTGVSRFSKYILTYDSYFTCTIISIVLIRHNYNVTKAIE